MQFSRESHLYGAYSRYRIGNEDGPPYFQPYTNDARPAGPYVTQSSPDASGDSNTAGSSRMWYNGFASLHPYPSYDEMHIHADPVPAYLPSQYLRTNPCQGSVQLVLDSFLAKLRCHDPTFGPTTQMDCGAYGPPGSGGRPLPIRPGASDKKGPAYNEYTHTSESHDPRDSLPIAKLSFGAWKCLVCEKMLRRKYVAVVHFWNKHGGLRFNCEGRCGTKCCTKSFASRDGLGVHLYPVMKECSDCGYLMLRRNLRRHKQQYCRSGNRPMGNE